MPNDNTLDMMTLLKLHAADEAFDAVKVREVSPLRDFRNYLPCGATLPAASTVSGFYHCCRPVHEQGQHVALTNQPPGHGFVAIPVVVAVWSFASTQHEGDAAA